MRHSLLAHPVLCLLLLAGSDVTAEDVGRKPNFVLIMVDDLGIGDIGCYGNDTIRTPNIDRLATEGVKLTQHIAAAPLCTPSRTAFMTGRYPIRAGMAGGGTERVLLFLANSGGLPPTETTFAKRLQQQGYNTGIVGKWHLGMSCDCRGDHCHHPNQQGFSFFYGLPYTLIDDCRPGEAQIYQAGFRQDFFQVALLVAVGLLTVVGFGMCGHPKVSWWLLLVVLAFGLGATALLLLASQFVPTWNCIIMRDQEVVEQPMAMETVPQRLLEEAQGFIERNVEHPFLLFFSLAHIHAPLFISPAFAGKSRHGRYGDNMEEVDWLIGEITKTVDSLGLANNTLIYFTSDHGGHLEDFDPKVGQRGGWNGIYKGGKSMGGWEGGIRVPGIFRWPGRLAPGRVLDQPTSLMDLYPTLKHLSRDTQRDRPLDGHNLMPLLEGTAERSEHEFMFHYCGKYLHAVRWHPPGSDSVYKVHYTTPNFYPPGAGGCYDTMYCECSGERVTQHDPPLLFDLFHDPSEARPLSPDTEPRYAEVLEQSAQAVKRHQRSVASAKPQVENQLTWDKLLWRPWLQPCCGTFPFCSCKE